MSPAGRAGRGIWADPSSESASRFAQIVRERRHGWYPSDSANADLWVVDADRPPAVEDVPETCSAVAFVGAEFGRLPTMEWAYFHRALNAETITRWLDGRFGPVATPQDSDAASAAASAQASDVAAAAASTSEVPRPAITASPWLRNTDDAPRPGRATGAPSAPEETIATPAADLAVPVADEAAPVAPAATAATSDPLGPSVVDVMRAFDEIERTMATPRSDAMEDAAVVGAPWAGRRFRLRHWPNVARYGEGPKIAYACGQLIGRYRTFEACRALGLDEATLIRIVDDASAAGNLEIEETTGVGADVHLADVPEASGALITGILTRYAHQ